MLVYWQQLHKLVEGIWNKVQGIETINHEIYDKLDEIQVGWKVAEDIKIKALVPKKIIPIDCYRFAPISIIDGDEVLFLRSSKLYKYQISTDTETEIDTETESSTNVIGGVWRKSTNYYFFNGYKSIDIYNSSFVFQSSITCDMRPMYGAWVDTNKFFLKGKDYDFLPDPPGIYPSQRGICINGNIEEWTTTKQSETKYSNYPILWKRNSYTMVYKPFMSMEGIFICDDNKENIYYLSTDIFNLTQSVAMYCYWDFYIGSNVIISAVDYRGANIAGGVVYVC